MNRAQLRADVRTRITDPAIGGLVTDAELNTMLAAAHARTGARAPVREVVPTAVAVDAVTVAHPDTLAVRVVRDDAGRVVPRVAPTETTAALGWWAATPAKIELTRPVRGDEAGTWAIEGESIPVFPTDDVTAVPLAETLGAALVAMACAAVVRARATDDAKRGRRVPYWITQLATDFEREADAIIAAHTRRALGGSLGPA